MKTFKLIVLTLLLFGCKNEKKSTITKYNSIDIEQDLAINNQDLIVVDQDYDKALKIASKMDKSIFIDFYTTWCAPCKELDKLVFQNDSIQKILKKNIILLKYNAENDTVFHLSKKHHVSSYPTGLILNKNGYVINRKYGFPGNDFEVLSTNVLDFIKESVELNEKSQVLKGYSNKIDVSKYPKFYIDYVNRTNTKINNSELRDYLINTSDKFSEEYFSTLAYFGRDAPVNIANLVLKNKQKYIDSYGKLDVDILMYFLAGGKFEQAIDEKSRKKFKEAVIFAKAGLSSKWTDTMVPAFEKEFLKAQDKWYEVYEINQKLKDNGKFDNGYINHFSWQVYKDCDDQKVIKKCLNWMKEVTDEEPTYLYLDTYAHLLYKSGNNEDAKNIALLALEVGKNEDDRTASIEKLIKKL